MLLTVLLAIVGFFLMTAFFFSRLRFRIFYPNNNSILFEYSIWWGIVHKQVEIPLNRLGTAFATKESIIMPEGVFKASWWNLLRVYNKMWPHFVKHINIKLFYWQTEIGAEDAAATGLLAGFMWGIKGYVVGYLTNEVASLAKIKVDIVPCYNRLVLATTFECIFDVTIGHIMLARFKSK